jgi:transketolase
MGNFITSGLEDISLFRAIPNSIVLYPSDAISTEKAVLIAANYKGIAYIRTGRQPCNLLYNNDTNVNY